MHEYCGRYGEGMIKLVYEMADNYCILERDKMKKKTLHIQSEVDASKIHSMKIGVFGIL